MKRTRDTNSAADEACQSRDERLPKRPNVDSNLGSDYSASEAAEQDDEFRELSPVEHAPARPNLDPFADDPTSKAAARDHRFRELYSQLPDIEHMARMDPELAKFCDGHFIDMKNPEAVMQLAKTRLKFDFDLRIELPADRLCPAVPNRHYYILWLKELLDSSTYNDSSRQCVGLDIGTGASCIYPLLGCRQRPSWHFIATDIDNHSLSYARANVQRNKFEQRISVHERKPSDRLIPLDIQGHDSIDFTMTNPPFYQSQEEMQKSAAKKTLPPGTACTGAPVEMVTTGGESAFVGRILTESLELRGKIQWYTAMFGFLQSVYQFVSKLKGNGIDNYAIKELNPSAKTKRWVVGWSFRPMRPSRKASRGVDLGVFGGKLPTSTEVTVFTAPLSDNVGEFVEDLSCAIGSLELMRWEWDRERLSGVGTASDKVWARAWRRRQMQTTKVGQEGAQVAGTSAAVGKVSDESPVVIGFKVSIHLSSDRIEVDCRWLEGYDPKIFESFGGYVRSTAKRCAESRNEE